MYCVIQEIELKKKNQYGEYKKLEVYEIKWSRGNGPQICSYKYRYSGERFERPIKKAYKISIHKSYRVDGRIKKKQWSICTMSYYDLIEYCPEDFILRDRLNVKLQEMNITEEQLWDMVYKKLQPIIDTVKEEYEATEEYKTHIHHRKIINSYLKAKENFENTYGSDTYDYCYDVFGTLRNKVKLEEIKQQYKQQQEYQSSYYGNYESNYNYHSSSSYLTNSSDTYTEKEKDYLKIIYKAAALKLHPDIKKDDGEGMKFLNELKDKWGI